MHRCQRIKILKTHIADYDALLIQFLQERKFITLKGEEIVVPLHA